MSERIFFNEEITQDIYKKTNGKCRFCHKNLVYSNRTKGKKGAWQIAHSNAISKGGSNNIRNLWAVCIAHNFKQGTELGAEYEKKFKYSNIRGQVKDFLTKNEFVIFDMLNEKRVTVS